MYDALDLSLAMGAALSDCTLLRKAPLVERDTLLRELLQLHNDPRGVYASERLRAEGGS